MSDTTSPPASQPSICLLPAGRARRDDFPWGGLTWFADAALGNSQELTVGRCVLKPGEGNPRHYHPNCSEVLVVLCGRILHTGPEGGEVAMEEGDTVTIPSGVWHCARNVGDGEAVLLIAFSSAERQTVGE